jgi:hypothetical protein
MKRTRSHDLVRLSLIFLIQGCALGQVMDVATPQDISQVEKSRVYPNSYDAVWAATIKSLSTGGVSIQSQEKSSGIISTGYVVAREASGPFVSGSRVKASILVEQLSPSSTQVTVTPTFESRMGDADWRRSQRRKNQLDTEKGLLDDIQNNL